MPNLLSRVLDWLANMVEAVEDGLTEAMDNLTDDLTDD